MTKEPSPNRGNGRDVHGRFVKGNTGGPGNPLAKRAARIRSALMQAVTAKDIREITIQLVQKAKSGDLAAIKILLDRTIGPPVEVDLLERLDALEHIIQERRP